MRLQRAAIGRTRSIGRRLHWGTAASVLSVAILLAIIFALESTRIGDSRLDLLRSIADSATAIAASYEKQERAGQLSRNDAQRLAAQAIGAIRYLGEEYVWINDMHPTMVMHPIKPELNGKDLSGMADPAGKHLFVAFADTVRAKGAGMVDYLWPRPGSEQPAPKLSYVRGFEPWGWVIGTGVYVDDLAAERRRIAWALAGFGAAAGLIVGIAIWLLGRSISRPIGELTAVTGLLSEGNLGRPCLVSGETMSWGFWPGRWKSSEATPWNGSAWSVPRWTSAPRRTGGRPPWTIRHGISARSFPPYSPGSRRRRRQCRGRRAR
jgi:methyl-accepting chemotaxis protein